VIRLSFLAMDGDLLWKEVTQGQLETFLDSKMKEGGQAFVRVASDEELFAVQAYVARTTLKAQRAVQLLSGATSPFWSQTQLWPDGDGWRIALVGMTARSDTAH
jgi:hypothetical protein